MSNPLHEFGLVLNPEGITSGAARAGQALDGILASAKRAEAAITALGQSGRLAGTAAQAVQGYTDAYKRGAITAETYVARLTAVERAFQETSAMARQAATAVGEVTAGMAQTGAAVGRLGAAGTSAGLGLGHMRGALVTLAAQASGTNPVVGRLASVLLTLGAGSALTVGVIAGAAAIAAAWSAMTESGRKAREATEKLLKEIDDAATRGLPEFVQAELRMKAAVDDQTDALERQRKELERLRGFAPGLVTVQQGIEAEPAKTRGERVGEGERQRALAQFHELTASADRLGAALSAGLGDDRMRVKAQALVETLHTFATTATSADLALRNEAKSAADSLDNSLHPALKKIAAATSQLEKDTARFADMATAAYRELATAGLDPVSRKVAEAAAAIGKLNVELSSPAAQDYLETIRRLGEEGEQQAAFKRWADSIEQATERVQAADAARRASAESLVADLERQVALYGQSALAAKGAGVELSPEQTLRFNVASMRLTELEQVDAASKAALDRDVARAKLYEQTWKAAVRGVEDSFSQFFTDIFSEGVRSFGDLARSIFKLVAQIEARLLAANIVGKLLGGEQGGGIFGKLLGLGGAVASGKSVSGWSGAQGDANFAYPVQGFAEGGWVGGKSPIGGEIPILAHKGERVLSRPEVGALASAGAGGPPVNVHTTVNLYSQSLDPRAGAHFLHSQAATIVNLVAQGIQDVPAFARMARGR